LIKLLYTFVNTWICNFSKLIFFFFKRVYIFNLFINYHLIFRIRLSSYFFHRVVGIHGKNFLIIWYLHIWILTHFIQRFNHTWPLITFIFIWILIYLLIFTFFNDLLIWLL
jgi:hypothetical protein